MKFRCKTKLKRVWLGGMHFFLINKKILFKADLTEVAFLIHNAIRVIKDHDQFRSSF